MVKIISSLLVTPLDGLNEAEKALHIINQQNEIESSLKENKERNPKIEWVQSSTTDGKNIFTTLTAIITTT